MVFGSKWADGGPTLYAGWVYVLQSNLFITSLFITEYSLNNTDSKFLEQICGGCPSKSWTFVITQDCVPVILWYFHDVFIYTYGNHFASIWVERQFRQQRGTCIKGLFWPPLEPKTESCFSPISSYWCIRRIAQVLNSGIYFTFTGCYGNQNGRQNRLNIEKLSF